MVSLASAIAAMLLSKESCDFRISELMWRRWAMRSSLFESIRDGLSASGVAWDRDADDDLVGGGEYSCASSLPWLSVCIVGIGRSRL